MTPRWVVQACELVDQLLRPPEETSVDVSGNPVETQNDSLGICCEAEQTTVSGLGKLADVVSRLSPLALQSLTATWSPAAMIEEVSDQQAQLDEAQLLMAKSCQAAALYAADAALLTPWSSHQLDVAARTLLKQLCAAMPGAFASPSSQEASVQCNEQDFIVAMVPAILHLLSPALKLNGTCSITQGTSQQEGETSASSPVQLKSNAKPGIVLFVHLQHVQDSLMFLALIVQQSNKAGPFVLLQC